MSGAPTPPEVASFVVRIAGDAEYRHRRFGVTSAVLSYPKSEIAALRYARQILETIIERKRPRVPAAIPAAIEAIGKLRETAAAEGDNVLVTVTPPITKALKDSMAFFIEYEVYWENDRRGRGR